MDNNEDPLCYKLSEKKDPLGQLSPPRMICRLCDEMFTENGILDDNYLCPECASRLKHLVVKKLETIGLKIPNIAAICQNMYATLDEYAKSGVPKQAIEKNKKWVADKVWELMHFKSDIDDAIVDAYQRNNILPVVKILDEHRDLQDG